LPGDGVPPIEGALSDTAEQGTLVATGEVLGLDQVARREGLSVADQIALHDAQLRQSVADRILHAFTQANIVMLVALAVLVILDEVNLGLHLMSPRDRIVTSRVFMTLLGATAVQVGAVSAIIARYLFPGR
jgi:hypothetical protein